MIALTQRLNERDEQIMALQDELDAYDRHQRELEEKLDEKTAEVIRLERLAMEIDAAPIPQIGLQDGNSSPEQLHQQGNSRLHVLTRTLLQPCSFVFFRSQRAFASRRSDHGGGKAASSHR